MGRKNKQKAAKKQQRQQQSQQIGEEITDEDVLVALTDSDNGYLQKDNVLMATDVGYEDHPGNIYFRDLIGSHANQLTDRGREGVESEQISHAISLLTEGAVRHLIDVKISQQNKKYVQPVVVQIIGFEFNPVLTQPVCWNVIISDGCNAVKATFDPNSSKLNALVSRGPVLYKLIRISEFSTWKDRIYILNADAVWVQRKYNQTMIGNPIEIGIVSTKDGDERKSINEYSKAMPDYNETYPVSTTTNAVLTFQVSDFEHLEVKLKGDKKNAASFDGGHLSKTMTDTSSGVKFKLLIYPRGDTLYMSQHGWASFHLICMDTFPTKPSTCRIWNKTIRIVGRVHLGGGKSTPIESAFKKVGDHWKISKLIQHVDVATTCLNELGDWIINVDLEITVDGTSWSPHFLNT